MPEELAPEHDPRAKLPPLDPELLWVEPAPASLVGEDSPEARYASRESVQLAFIVALQHLPATQRAAVILRDVVGWSAAEVAELLDMTPASVNSALQRARETLDGRKRPAAPVDRAVLEKFMRVWEAADLEGLAALLHDDVITSMPPNPAWFRGREALVTFLRTRMGEPGHQRAVLVEGADEVVLAFYRDDLHGATGFTRHSIKLVRFEEGRVRDLHVFLERELFDRWDLPATLAT
jgi:RNA polymerase sigma-70 factor (ECF subfamily)